eukprot:tig00021493_g21894.t1
MLVLSREAEKVREVRATGIALPTKMSLLETCSRDDWKFGDDAGHTNFGVHLEWGEFETELPWNIDARKLALGERIVPNSGGYADLDTRVEIFRGIYNGKVVAVKRVTRVDEYVDAEKRRLRSEADIHWSLQSPRVVALVGASLRPPSPILVMEYMGRGNLKQIIRNSSLIGELDQKQIMLMALQIAEGLHYLQSRQPPVIHKDFKSENIFVDDLLNVKIGDFSASHRRERSGRHPRNPVGDRHYRAPEVERMRGYDERSDVYGLGVVLWELLARRPVEAWLRPEHITARVLEGGERPPIPPDLPAALAGLLARCWAEEPSGRPSTAEIVGTLRQALAALDL